MRSFRPRGAIVLTLLCLAGSALCNGQTTRQAAAEPGRKPPQMVPFDTDRWLLAEGAATVSFGGRSALAGTAYLKDVELLNGTVEVDIWIAGEIVNFAGIMFRVQSFEEYEWCWLRTHKTNGKIRDGIQYAPAFKGATCWQFNGGPRGIGPVYVPKNEWVHMKMEILDESAALYVTDMTQPVMSMDLQLGLKKGSVGLQTFSTAAAGVYFSNFAYQIDETTEPVPPEEKAAPPNVVAKWRLSPHYRIAGFETISTYPERELTELQSWITPDVDVSGLVNITRYYGRPGGIGVGAPPDCAILRTVIETKQDKRVRMSFGYSDAAAIFLNRNPLFFGNNAFLSRNQSDGEWISFNDAVFLDLKKGRNELLVVVAEEFGGWGFQARLDDVDGLEVVP
jgi:hypothetical protein